MIADDSFPKDRIELYDACTHMLLERREIERQIDYSDYPSLTYRQKKALLRRICILVDEKWVVIS